MIRTLGALLALVLLAVACGQPAVSTPAVKPPSGAASAAPAAGSVASQPVPGGAPDWAAVQAAARTEGRVVVTGPPFPGLRTGIVEGFQKAHGITAEYLGLPTGEVLTRIDQEARLGSPQIDVQIGGNNTCWTLGERGQADPIDNVLLAPEVTNPAAWRGGKPRFFEPSPAAPAEFHCGLQTAEWVMTDLFVNPELVPPSSIRSWQDLLRPEYRGKIAVFDPRRPGPGQTTSGYLNTLFGMDYLERLFVGQQVMLSADHRQLAEWVARGNYPIGIALVQAAVEPLRQERLPIERVFPDDGPGVLTGGFGVVLKVKGGPHPNAATTFVNWFAGREAQEMYEREMMETTLRADVTHQVPDYVIPKQGVAYPVDSYEPGQFFGSTAPTVARLQEILSR
jgi:ABC-type Fe3+ transport system substrate-binding protein